MIDAMSLPLRWFEPKASTCRPERTPPTWRRLAALSSVVSPVVQMSRKMKVLAAAVVAG